MPLLLRQLFECLDSRSQVSDLDVVPQAVEENPLPASMRIRLRPEYQSFEQMDSIATVLEQHESVEEVQFGANAVQVMDRLFATLRSTGLSLAVVIGLVVLFVVANTIRLTIVARRDLLRTISVLGASGAFIRVPLILEGVIVCMMASVIALGLIYGLYLLLEPRLAILPAFLPITWMVAYVGAAAILGAFGGIVGMLRLETRRERE